MSLADAWRRLVGSRGQPPDDGRVVVVDTETSGLDAARDVLVSIGAVAVDGDGVRPGDSFEVVLRNAAAGDAANVAIHGVGHEAQAAGTRAAEALASFRDYVAGARLVAFHAEFDRAMLRRAFANAGLPFDERRWLDLAPLAEALAPARARAGAHALDDWIEAFGIDAIGRHSAAADALATAELYLRLRAIARTQGARDVASLIRVAADRRWLAGR